MSVKVRLGAIFGRITKGRGVVEVSPCTLGECVDRLENDFPGMKQALFDPLVHVFVNGNEAMLPEDSRRKLKSGDEVQIQLAAVA